MRDFTMDTSVLTNMSVFLRDNASLQDDEASSRRDALTFRSNTFQIVQVSVWCFLLTFAVVMNSLVIFRVIVDRKLHSPTFIILCNLSLADMLYVISFVVGDDSVQSFLNYKLDDAAYFLTIAFSNTVAASSAWHLVVLSVVRFHIIVHPIKSRVWLTTNKTILICTGTWIMCLIISIGLILTYIFGQSYDNMEMLVPFFSYMIQFIIPFFTILVFDVSKLRKLSITIKEIRTCRKSKAKLSRMVYVILILFGCLCTPRLILTIICTTKDFSFCEISFEVSGYLYVLNSCVNPVIYCFLSPTFRKSLKTTFLSRPSRSSSVYRSEVSD